MKLMKAWALNPAVAAENAQYMAYGRCYRNRTATGWKAELYTGADQYKDVYWDNALTALSFFGTGTTVQSVVNNQTDLHLVFFLNLAKIKPGIVHRADEEVRQTIISAVGKNSFGAEFISYETGIENVLREYPGSYRDALAFVDMHPVHALRLNFTFIYNMLKNC